MQNPNHVRRKPGKTGGARIAIACSILMIVFCFQKGADLFIGHPEKAQASEMPAASGTAAITFGDKFYDVSMPDKDHIWVVGYFGAIVHSADGGRNWVRQDAGVELTLTGVSFVSPQEGFVVGDEGTILHTGNGGETWEQQANPVPDQKLLKVQFLNAQEGYAVGAFGTILSTIDGGKTWEKLPFDEDIILNDLVFLNSKEGWIAGEFETILHTSDGGMTFDYQRGDELGEIFGIAFKDSTQGVAVGTTGKILVTSDGGLNWEEKKNSSEDTLLKVDYFDSKLIAIGLRGAVAVSTDDGQNWSQQVVPGHYAWLSGVAFTEGAGVVVGNDGKILMTHDNGSLWTRLGMGFEGGGKQTGEE